jgi:hypothetical protein
MDEYLVPYGLTLRADWFLAGKPPPIVEPTEVGIFSLLDKFEVFCSSFSFFAISMAALKKGLRNGFGKFSNDIYFSYVLYLD